MSKTDISSDYLLNALKRVLKETKVDSLEYLPTVGGGEKLLSDRTLRKQPLCCRISDIRNRSF